MAVYTEDFWKDTQYDGFGSIFSCIPDSFLVTGLGWISLTDYP